MIEFKLRDTEDRWRQCKILVPPNECIMIGGTYRIRGVEYATPTPEFIEAVNKEQIWDKLSDKGSSFDSSAV